MVDTLLYQHTELYDKARARYPLLVDDWLLRVRVGRLSRDAVHSMEAQLSDARRAFTDWTHDLALKSSYTAWAPAQTYQRHMVGWAQQLFAGLVQTGALPPLERPETILTDIEMSHHLLAVQGPAKRNMLKFLEDQINRLHLFARIAATLPAPQGLAGVLHASNRTHHDELLLESRAAQPIVSGLYTLAIAELAP